jgi:hypothetical protein
LNLTHPHRIGLLHESDSSFFFLISGHVDGRGNILAGRADGWGGYLAGSADGHGGNNDLLGHTDSRGADRTDTGGSGLADTWSLGGLLSPAGVEAAGVWSSSRGLSPARGTREATSSPLLWNGYRREKTAGERGERIYIFLIPYGYP